MAELLAVDALFSVFDVMWEVFMRQAAENMQNVPVEEPPSPIRSPIRDPGLPAPEVPGTEVPGTDAQTDRSELAMQPAWPNRRTLATQTDSPELSSWYHITLEQDCHVIPCCL